MKKKHSLLQFIGLLYLSVNGFNCEAQVVDTTFKVGTGANNVIYSTVIQPDQKILIAGNFTVFNGKSCNRIARLNTDGSLDNTFNINIGSGANDYILSVDIQPDGKIIAGGLFTNFNGKSVKRVIRLNSDGTSDSSFDVTRNPLDPLYAGAADKVLKVKYLSDGKILVGGCFKKFNGYATNYIARLNPNGDVDTEFSSISLPTYVKSFGLQSDGKIFVSVQSSSYPLYRLNTNGSTDLTFKPDMSPIGEYFDFAQQDDGKSIIVGPYIFNKAKYKCISRLNLDGSIDLSFRSTTSPDAMYGLASVVVRANKKLIVGGGFYLYDNKPVINLAQLNSDGSLDSTFNGGSGTNNDVTQIAEQQDRKVIITGNFTIVDGKPYNRIARLIGKYPPPATPVITASTSLIFCQGDSVTLSAPSGFAGYQWSNGDTTSSIKVRKSGFFTVKIKQANTDFSQASASANVQVNALPNLPIITISPSLNICQGDSITLSAPSGFASYYWSTGSTTPSIKVKVKGIFTVTVGNANQCKATSQPVAVQVSPLPAQPIITVNGSANVCAGDSVLLAAPEGFTQYQWSNGATSSNIQAKASGTYSVKVRNAQGCESVASTLITVAFYPLQPTPTIVMLSADTLMVTTISSSYQWRQGNTLLSFKTQKIYVQETGQYTVQVKNSQGCFSAPSPAYTFLVMGLPQEETPDITFRMYPNPSSGILQLESDRLPAQFEISLINSVGQIVYTHPIKHFTGRQIIELKYFTGGLHILQIRTNQELFRKKILMQ